MLLLSIILYLAFTLQVTKCFNQAQSYNDSIQALSEVIQRSNILKTVQDVQLEREFLTVSEKVWQKYKNKEYALLTLSMILSQKREMMLQELSMDTDMGDDITTATTSTPTDVGHEFNLTRHLVNINSGLKLALEKTPLNYYSKTLQFLRKTPRSVIIRMYKEIMSIATTTTKESVEGSGGQNSKAKTYQTRRKSRKNTGGKTLEPGLGPAPVLEPVPEPVPIPTSIPEPLSQPHAKTKKFLGSLATSLILLATLMDTCGNSPVVVCQILLVLVVMGLLFWAVELTTIILDTRASVDVTKLLLEIAKG